MKNLDIHVIEPDKNNIKFMKKFKLKVKGKFIENLNQKKIRFNYSKQSNRAY